MAWPKLRGNKSPARLVASGNHSGAAPNGARSHRGPGPDRAGPAPGPAAPGPAPAPAAEADDAAEASSAPSFLDWGQPEDEVELDDLPDAVPAAGSGGGQSGTIYAQAGPPKAPWKLTIKPAETADGEPPPPGIGETRGNLAHLAAHPRRRFWVRRAIIAVVVGVAFSLLVSWRLGLTLAVIAAIADTIYQSRKLPGRRLKLTVAQRQTRKQLNQLARAGYRAIHANPIPESKEQIDHLVVGPTGVFAIDSEAWDKHLVVRTKNARQLWHGPFSMKERLEHARWESQQASELLSDVIGRPITVRPAMAVYGPKIPWDVATIREVDVFSGPRLRKYLRRRANESGQPPLTDADVERIFKAANEAFPHLTADGRVA
jgi:Nuclease-related domain